MPHALKLLRADFKTCSDSSGFRPWEACCGVLKAPLIAVFFLLAGTPGCRVAPLPGQADAAEYGKTSADTRLFNNPAGPQSENSSRGKADRIETTDTSPGSEVTQAAAVQPAADSHTTILPPSEPELEGIEKEDSGFEWEDLAPSNIYKQLKAAVGLGPDETVARTAYEQGENLYNQKKYKEAAKQFATAAARWPDSVLEEDALFMLGECYFFSDQYPKANDTYQKLLKKHEFSRHLDKAVARLFAIGRYWEQMQAAEPHWPVTPNLADNSRPLFDTWGHALKAYEQIRMNDPTGPLADDSLMASGNAYFLTGRYEDAAYQYDLLRQEYPKSEHQIAAHVLGMKSKLEVYQGPLYDGTPLEEAGKVAQQALTQFPGQLGEEKELMIKTRNRIIEEQAERDWAIGEYYDNKKCYGAARLYYRAIVEDYPQTRVAEKARARLEEIKGLPAEPPNRFKVLTDLFSTREEIVLEGPAKTLDINP